MPTSSAIRASLRLSGQLPDQRSGTSVTARPDEQLAPNRPILSLFALCIDMRSCAEGAGASTVLLPQVSFDTAGQVRLAHGHRVLNGSAGIKRLPAKSATARIARGNDKKMGRRHGAGAAI